MKNIYVIFGETGKYDDWNDWPVIAFTKKEDADIYAARLQEQADNWVKLKAEKCRDMNYTECRQLQESLGFLDEQFSCDGETEYNVIELELRNKL